MELHWKLYKITEFRIISLGLLLLTSGVRSNCNYYQYLDSEKTYYIYNQEYPGPYYGENHCIWKMESPYVMKLNCSINMLSSADCSQDSLSIQFAEENAQKYCGKGSFTVEGMNANIKLDSYNSPGSTFICEVKSFEKSLPEESFDDNEYNCQCGWRNFARIVGGTETGVNEYPMMAGLVDSLERQLYCGATIISEQNVITAAHCVERKNISTIGVIVGEHDVSTGSETNSTKLYRIDNCIMHPQYHDHNNDIAVCKIIGNIQYTSQVGPVCLPFQHSYDSFGGNIVTALGWGLLEFGGAKANTLQKVDLNIINEMQCKKYYPNVTPNNVCTYTPGKDSCQMDSGGPVLWQNPTTHNLILVGITSYGVGCASDEPAVEIRVGAYIDWIQSVTPGVKYCKVE